MTAVLGTLKATVPPANIRTSSLAVTPEMDYTPATGSRLKGYLARNQVEVRVDNMRFRQVVLQRDPGCPVCGDHPTIRELTAYDQVCAPGDSTDLTAEQFREWRRTGRQHTLIDVREPFEHAQARIDGSVLIPLGSLESQLAEVPRDRPVVVHCQSGGRSSRAAEILRRHGYVAHNLLGGIRAWKTLEP